MGEAFHEGWWAPTLFGRLAQTIGYLVPMIVCIGIGAVALARPKVGHS